MMHFDRIHVVFLVFHHFALLAGALTTTQIADRSAESCDIPEIPASDNTFDVHLLQVAAMLEELTRMMQDKLESLDEHPEFIAEELDMCGIPRFLDAFQSRGARHALAAKVCQVYWNDLMAVYTFHDFSQRLEFAMERVLPIREFVAVYAQEFQARYATRLRLLYFTFVEPWHAATSVPVPVLRFLRHVLVTRLTEWTRVRKVLSVASQRLRDAYPDCPQQLWSMVDECFLLVEIMHHLSPILLTYSPVTYLRLRFPRVEYLDVSPALKQDFEQRSIEDLGCIRPILEHIPFDALQEQCVKIWDEWKAVDRPVVQARDSIGRGFLPMLSRIYDSSELSMYPLEYGENPLLRVWSNLAEPYGNQFHMVKEWSLEHCTDRVRLQVYQLKGNGMLDTHHFRVLGQTAIEAFTAPCPLTVHPLRKSLVEILRMHSKALHYDELFAWAENLEEEEEEEELQEMETEEGKQEDTEPNIAQPQQPGKVHLEDRPKRFPKKKLSRGKPTSRSPPPSSPPSASPTSKVRSSKSPSRSRSKHLCAQVQRLGKTVIVTDRTHPELTLDGVQFTVLCRLFNLVEGQVKWRAFVDLMERMGAHVEEAEGSRTRFRLHGGRGVLDRPHGRDGNVLSQGKMVRAQKLLQRAFAVDVQNFRQLSIHKEALQ